MTEKNGIFYPSESAQRELANEYQLDNSLVGFQECLRPFALDERSLRIRVFSQQSFCLRVVIRIVKPLLATERISGLNSEPKRAVALRCGRQPVHGCTPLSNGIYHDHGPKCYALSDSECHHIATTVTLSIGTHHINETCLLLTTYIEH